MLALSSLRMKRERGIAQHGEIPAERRAGANGYTCICAVCVCICICMSTLARVFRYKQTSANEWDALGIQRSCSVFAAAYGSQQQVIYLYFSDSIKQFDLLLLFFLSVSLAACLSSSPSSSCVSFPSSYDSCAYVYYASFQPQTFYYDRFHLFLVHLNVYMRMCLCVMTAILTISSTWYALFVFSFRWRRR